MDVDNKSFLFWLAKSQLDCVLCQAVLIIESLFLFLDHLSI